MPELAEVTPQATAGFVSRSRSKYKDKIEKDEQELKELMDNKTEETPPVEETEAKPEETLSDEEKSFKVRYGDLRRHSQQKDKELNEKIKALEEKLGQTEHLVPPKSEEDIAAWVAKYPDVAGIVETIADKRAKQMFDKANIQIEELTKAKSEATRSRAENEIREQHKDFDKLRNSEEFHNWVEEQPKWVQNALYENTDDPASVVRVLDLYKIDNGLTPSDKKNKRKAAASTVTKRSKTEIDVEDANNTISESEVAKMSTTEFEERSDEINKAIRSGKFVYDISGNAR